MIQKEQDVQRGLSFSAYCQRYGAAITLETGRWTSLAERIEKQIAGTLGAISAFEKQHQA